MREVSTYNANLESAVAEKRLTVALAGNPNAGKTTLFNALTGLRQKVANYSGVTVERKEGAWHVGEKDLQLIDLPGLYSLEAASLDEKIAREVLLGEIQEVAKPDVVIAVVDATNLDRNLYLVTQLIEYDIPLVIVLTMMDTAKNQAIEIDCRKLSEHFGFAVVPVNVKQGKGLNELATAVENAAKLSALPPKPLFLSEKHTEHGRIIARYDWINRIVEDSTAQNISNPLQTRFSDKIDNILTHRIFGYVFLLGILLFVFNAIFSWAELPMNLLDGAFGALNEAVKAQLPKGLLTDLLTDGVISGVGSVFVFLPQILFLFLFLSILEDSGYMARAAFLMDRLMRSVGLHGKAFVPLLSSFACAIPGIMATRTIENPKDRLTTILIAPFMSCSARLPVYTLMIGAFFSGQKVLGFLSLGAVLMLAMYLLGIITAIFAAFVLKRTVLKSPPPPLVMELPPYRLPNIKTVALNMFERASMFVKRAGTVILAISIVLWALTTFPRLDANADTASPTSEIHQPASGEDAAADTPNDPVESAAGEADEGAQIRQSYAGRIGHFIEPAIKPLGYDWKIGIALISSFAAREVLVSTLSIVYNGGADAEADSPTLLNTMHTARRDDGTPAFTPLVALSLMVFFVLACQCISTVAVVRRETNSWAWTILMVGYMTFLAYVGAFVTFQGGKLLGFQ